ncbi:hypothetical protein PVK06_029659 [Gossypium arboreum]|uniref:Retrotransposon gag domain-containing protein n=1 Tax=Gossypium arboreum TaxID=29729 RepID=A0ABR0NL62_GOSAR|nr:hypothetical protein PVK06_029659 [Gossypium arboreum]
MSKEEFEQRWARKTLREMLPAVEKRRDSMQKLLDSQIKKLTERKDTLKAMMKALKEETMATMMALSTRIEELEGELSLCRAAMEKGVSSATLSNEDVPKPKEFMGTRSACDVDNFMWRMENYFCAKGIMYDAVKFYPEFTEEEARAKLQGIIQRGTIGKYVQEFKELLLQVSDVTQKEALLAFQVEQRGVQKLSEAMAVVESVVKLSLGKDKLGSSKSEERGVREKDHKEDVVDGNGNDNNGGNGKP